MSAYKTATVDRELAFPGTLREGDRGPGVKRIQEWLTLVSMPGVGNISPDGEFGPATVRAVRELQRLSGLASDGVVGLLTWARLVQPLTSVTKDEGQALGLLGLEVVRAARRHLAVHPREVGGQNLGPWVRVYCDGNEGAAWAWCAGFVTYVLRQGAANSGGAPDLGPRTFSCDVLAESYAKRGKLLAQATPVMVASRVRPGDIFFVVSPANLNDRHHTGLVAEVSGDGKTVRTIEGNGLPLDAPVLTPKGWREIGAFAVGDIVCDPQGMESRVTGVYPQGERDVFRLVFTDGTEIVADGEHRWSFSSGPKRGGEFSTLTTLEAAERLAGGARLFLPEIKPVEFDNCDLPLDPYLLGVLLGDGGMSRPSSVRLTTKDVEILDGVTAALPEGCEIRPVTGIDFRITGPIHDTIRALGLDGKTSHGKFIPHQYKFGSVAERTALLQGLMDTDGSVDLGGRIEFCSVSRQLAEDVLFLVQSLGGKAGFCRKSNITYTSPTQHEKKSASDAYILRNIRFPTSAGVAPFRLARKAARVKARGAGMMRGWGVKSITAEGRAETVCIAVSAPSRLYMTEGCIPTHNTNDDGSREGYEVCERTRGVGKLDFGLVR